MFILMQNTHRYRCSYLLCCLATKWGKRQSFKVMFAPKKNTLVGVSPLSKGELWAVLHGETQTLLRSCEASLSYACRIEYWNSDILLRYLAGMDGLEIIWKHTMFPFSKFSWRWKTTFSVLQFNVTSFSFHPGLTKVHNKSMRDS